MDATNLFPLIEQLDDEIDDLEEALEPILNKSVIATSKNLPVLDKAKFHIWVTYTLENLIFFYLRLHGVNAREHPVFRELARVKQYFDKVTALETEPEQRTMKLDKEAAGRFIKHGLAGNDKIDSERKEQEAKERARAQLKAFSLAKKADQTPDSPANDQSDDSNNEESEHSEWKPSTEMRKQKKEDKKHKRQKPKGEKKRGKEERKPEKKERRKKKEEVRKTRKEGK